MKSNRCVVIVEPKRFEMQNRDFPAPEADEVLVRVEYVGICGSDVHLFQTGRQGDNVATAPMILSHEAAGAIDRVGDAVRRN